MVPKLEWVLAADLAVHRQARLLQPLTADHLINALGKDADVAATAGRIAVQWEPSLERPGYFRFAGQIPVSERVFDQLFNGRSGYRAHYFLSVREGERFNRLVLERLASPLMASLTQGQLSVAPNLALYSLNSAYSKIWVWEETAAFNEAPPAQLTPARWVRNGCHLGCRAPLPSHCTVDVKGTFVHPGTRDVWVDEMKLGRSQDLFDKGFT